tara:strand:+ start:2139 stop:2246 length:108 start_codon:yes stop_codon:yes gene_type:complete
MGKGIKWKSEWLGANTGEKGDPVKGMHFGEGGGSL